MTRPEPPGGRSRSLVYYVDGHGFGHATRSLAVLRALRRRRPELGLILRTSAPAFLFRGLVGSGVRLIPGDVDPGTVQEDPLSLDVQGSLAARRAFQRELPARVGRELELLDGAGVGIVAGDIPPLAFEVAHALGVPSVALGNFSWDWIYEEYAGDAEDGQELVDALRRSYARADLLLRMPLCGAMPAFSRVEDIPHVVLPPTEDSLVLRRRLGLESEERPLILVSFGGFGGLQLEGAPGDPGPYRFLVPGRVPAGLPADTVGLHVDHGHAHQDLVAMSDAVISKPGYGTVAECLAARTPLLYTSRDRFREYPVLVDGLRKGARCRFLPRQDLLALRWRAHLESLLADHRPWPPVRTDGAEVAAARLLEIHDRAG